MQTLHKLKNRIINFRVTDEELTSLKTASNLHGARCLSEFTRTVMLGTATGSAPAREWEGSVEERIHSLDGRLVSIESDLLRLINMLSFAGEACRKPQD
jgi:hypothetical protein